MFKSLICVYKKNDVINRHEVMKRIINAAG